MSAGKFNIIAETPERIDILLYDFDIGSEKLKNGHLKVIKLYVLGFLIGGKGTVSAIGISSRTGSKKYNLRLSKRRALSVANHLFSLGVGAHRVHDVSGLGESLATFGLMADGTESELHRGVLISAWLKTTPPPPLPVKKPNLKKYNEKTCEVLNGASSAENKAFAKGINNNERWIIKGGEGKGNHRTLHRFIKEFEATMLAHTDPVSRQFYDSGLVRMLNFYRTTFFKDWYLYGWCGVTDKYPSEQINRWLYRFLTAKGRATHGLDSALHDPANWR